MPGQRDGFSQRKVDVDSDLHSKRLSPFLGGGVQVSFYEGANFIPNSFSSEGIYEGHRNSNNMNPENDLGKVNFRGGFIRGPSCNHHMVVPESPGEV
ncbi:hypothetical protein CASFOL_030912 [Castilleja foliolosa]|uniref:Uncharacterized protein n=1 Tax=Castilleja foliolosa TaxID=1961234 RepID=A0ABD3C7G4_9LAMI